MAAVMSRSLACDRNGGYQCRGQGAAQQELVTAELAAGWLGYEVAANVHEAIRARYGREQFEQEATVALCESACLYDPVRYPDVPFGAYARRNVRHRLWRAAHLVARVRFVNRSMPVNEDGDPAVEPEDHRRTEGDPALRAWCSPDYAEQRRCLDMRARVILYLRCVAGWTLEEAGAVFGMSLQRVQQLEQRAVEKLAQRRRKERQRD